MPCVDDSHGFSHTDVRGKVDCINLTAADSSLYCNIFPPMFIILMPWNLLNGYRNPGPLHFPRVHVRCGFHSELGSMLGKLMSLTLQLTLDGQTVKEEEAYITDTSCLHHKHPIPLEVAEWKIYNPKTISLILNQDLLL